MGPGQDYGKDVRGLRSALQVDAHRRRQDRRRVRLRRRRPGGPRRRQAKGFAIAGADKKFVWADAKVVGDTVVVSSPQVKTPVAVRYAWANNPDCNLVNKAGLPASPFRTDKWEQ